MKGKDVNLDWVEGDESAMTEPIAVLDPEGLEMEMPPDDFTVDDIAQLVGEQTPVEVMGAVWCDECGKHANGRVCCRCGVAVWLAGVDNGEVGGVLLQARLRT